MMRRTVLWMVSVLMVVMVVPGCASKTKERITMLEETNAGLSEQLNRCRSELDGTCRERDEMGERLALAMRDAEDLRMQLAASVSEPESEAPGWTPVPGGAMIAIEGEILFAPGKEALRPGARRTLDEVVSAVQSEYAGKHIFVFGHTDDRPIKKSGWKDNWELSTQRALSVVRFLRDRGVSPARLVGSGCGEYRPRVDNSSKANRARNRRVEIFAIDPQLLASR